MRPCGETADSTQARGMAVRFVKSRSPVALRVVEPVTGGFNSTSQDSFRRFLQTARSLHFGLIHKNSDGEL